MDTALSPAGVAALILACGGWAVLLCLRTLATELEFQSRLARLVRQARELRRANEERRRRLQEATRPRPMPSRADAPAPAPEPPVPVVATMQPAAEPPLAKAA